MMKNEYYSLRDENGFWNIYSNQHGLLHTGLKFEKVADATRYCDLANFEEEERLENQAPCYYDLGPSG
jgi:hypothetical protein